MPGPHSKTSRALANVRLQLRTGKTRGPNPRPLSADEIQALELKRAELLEQMAEARHQRSVNRINDHTTRQADLTRAAVKAEGEKTRGAVTAQLQPLTRLIDGENGTIDERIKARQNQISLLHAANRQDRLQRKQQLNEARESRSLSAARGKRPRVHVNLNAHGQPYRKTAVQPGAPRVKPGSAASQSLAATKEDTQRPERPDTAEAEQAAPDADSDESDGGVSLDADLLRQCLPQPSDSAEQMAETSSTAPQSFAGTAEKDKQTDAAEADDASSDESDLSSSSSMEEDLSLRLLPRPDESPVDPAGQATTEATATVDPAEQATPEAAPTEPEADASPGLEAGAAEKAAPMDAIVIAVGGEPAHVLLRSTECKTVALRTDAILSCDEVVGWHGGDAYDLNDGDNDPMLACVWQDICRHRHYGKPTASMAKVWAELHALLKMLDSKPPNTVKVKVAGTMCRGDKLYTVKIAHGAEVHQLKN